MEWNDVVQRVTPYIVKIETPTGYGSGFLCLYNETKNLCGIATAYHVVRDTEEWQQPLRILHYPSTTQAFLKDDQRIVYYNAQNDSAVLLIKAGQLDLPEKPIPLLPTERPLDVGTEVGWLGFPSIAQHTLCFFSGNISAWQENTHTYLIDGVAIGGVSGGPVLCMSKTEGVQIVGTVSAYRAGNVGGGTTPGLAFAQDVSYFHDVAGRVKSFDEAKKEEIKQTQEQEQQQQGQAAGEPANPPTEQTAKA